MAEVMVAVDFSPCSRRALEAAAALARDLRAKMVVVHAFTRHAKGWGLRRWKAAPLDPINQVYAEEALSDALRLTEEWLEPLRHRGARIEVIAEEGKAKAVILEVMQERAPALVVVGHHGRGGPRLGSGSVGFLAGVMVLGRDGARLGSVAKAVLDGARCPVVVVPESSGRGLADR